MRTQRWFSTLPWSGVLLALLIGIATRDCILMASAAMLAIYVARTHVEHGEAVDLLRSAIQCWVVGGASLLVTLVLLAWVAAMHAGLWDGNGLDTVSMLSVLGLCVLAVGVTTVVALDASRLRAEFTGFGTLGLAMVLAALVAREFDASGPCLFALGVAAITAISGWQLARRIGTELARTAVRI